MSNVDTTSARAEIVAGGGARGDTSGEKLTLAKWFDSNRNTVSDLLKSSGMDADRFKRAIYMVGRNTNHFAECTVESLAGASLKCAYYGLEPGPMGHVWLLPFWHNVRGGQGYYELQFILGYKGMIELYHRGGTDIDIHTVREGDQFDYAYGSEPFLKHKPMGDPDGRAIECYYGVAFHEGMRSRFWVVYPSEILAHKKRSTNSSSNSSPWHTDPEAMALKTVVRIGDPWIPKSQRVQQAIDEDERILVDRAGSLEGVEAIDIPALATGVDPSESDADREADAARAEAAAGREGAVEAPEMTEEERAEANRIMDEEAAISAEEAAEADRLAGLT